MGQLKVKLRGRSLLTFMVMTVVCPAYMLLGYNNAVVGGLLDLKSFVEVFPRTDTVNTKGSQKDSNALIQGTVVSLYLVGCMIGALSCIKMGDKLGRLKTISVGCVFTIIGSIILSSSFSLGQFMAGRIILGIGFGCISATVPVWQSECAPAAHRGALVVLEGVFASAGLALSQWINLGLYFAKSSVSWRFPIAFPIIFAACILAALRFQPDSPRWLVKKKRVEEAKQVMAAIYDCDVDSAQVTDDIRKMEFSLQEASKGSFRDLFKIQNNLLHTRTLLAMFSTFSQQLNGIGIVGFYTTIIYSSLLGLPPITARVLSGCTYVFQFFCSFIVFYTIDRIGRRKLMMFGTIGMGLTFVALAPLIANATHSKGCAGAAAALIFIFTMFFSVGALGINYLYGAEVAPLAHRTQIYALSTVTLWTFNFLVVEVTPSGFSKLEYKFFIVFAATNLLLLTPVVYFFFPETRRRSLEDIDAIFLTAKNSFEVAKVSRNLPQISILELDDSALKGQSDHAETVPTSKS